MPIQAPSRPENGYLHGVLFGGPSAATADQGALATAQEMHAGGADRDLIWQQTGWFRGPDGRWRFEIDDSQATATVPARRGTTSVENAVQHQGFLSAYRDLNRTPVDVGGVPGGDFGLYFPGNGRIRIRGRNADPTGAASDLDILLHELQHMIDHHEGNDYSGPAPAQPYISDRVRELRKQRDAFASAGNVTQVANFDDLIRRTIAWDQEQARVGEVMATAVERRRQLTPEQRRSRAPWLDYGVPEEAITVGQSWPPLATRPRR